MIKKNPPLKWNLASTWADDSEQVQVQHGNETLRYGPLVSQLINLTFRKHDDEVIVRSHDRAPLTNIFPIIMKNITTGDATYSNDTHGEVFAGNTMFKQAAIIVALEVTIAWLHRQEENVQPHKILIMAFYKRLLGNFRDYLELVLGGLIKDIALNCFGAEFYEMPSVKDLEAAGVIETVVMLEHGEKLTFKPVQNAHGTTATSVVAFLCRRQKTDGAYQGDAMNETYLFQLVSRARWRLYPIIEDLRSELVVPRSLEFEAASLGLKGVAGYARNLNQDQPIDFTSKVKRQFMIVKLLNAFWHIRVGHINAMAWGRGICDEDVYVTTRAPAGRYPTIQLKALHDDLVSRVSSTLFTSPSDCVWHWLWEQQEEKYTEYHKELTKLINKPAALQSQVYVRQDLISENMGEESKNAWLQILSTKADCFKQAPPPIPLAQIPEELRRTKVFVEDGAEPGDFQEEDARASPDVWTPVLINCLMVHFKAAKDEVLVEVPVMRCFGTDGKQLDTHFCIKLLWSGTCDFLERTINDANITVSSELTRHKKDEHQYGNDRFTVTLCGSDRVGFDIIFTDKGAEQGKVVFHMYPAMGVDLQSSHHATLLARCYDVRVLGEELSVAVHLWCIQISL